MNTQLLAKSFNKNGFFSQSFLRYVAAWKAVFVVAISKKALSSRDKNGENAVFCTPSKRASRATLRPEPLECKVYSSCGRIQSPIIARGIYRCIVGRGRIGGGSGILGGRTVAAGKGCVGMATGLDSGMGILAAASPIFISGNFISPN